MNDDNLQHLRDQETVALANAELPTLESYSSQTDAKAAKKKLGLGGWVCAAWLGLLLVVSLISPLLAADATGEVGCGDGSGLPIYHPTKCSDLEAKKIQSAEREPNEKLREIKLSRVKGTPYSHVFGVDAGGRDVLSRVLFGTRTTMFIAVASIALATLLGGAIGLVAGYFRSTADNIATMAFDVMSAFPPLILAMLLVITLAAENPDKRIFGIILALAIVATPILGRITRASTLSWSNREFVIAAWALGAKPMRIIRKDVVSNVAPALMSIAMLGIGLVVTTESALALIGLGVPDSTGSWGSVVASGSADFRNYYHLVFVTSVPIVLTVSALNFLGDALRRKFDVRESAL
jgi:peptide/nickel transport system permease protein